MSKEKLQSLTAYANDLKTRLSYTEVPAKHVNRPVQYREFLERELSKVTTKIDSLKMSNPSDKK